MERITMSNEAKGYLESLVEKVADDLVSIYTQSNQSRDYGLIFPRKRDGSLSVRLQHL